MTIREQIPTFLTEMPEPALALCLTPGTVPKFAPERVGQGVTNCRLLLFRSTCGMLLSVPSAHLTLLEARLSWRSAP